MQGVDMHGGSRISVLLFLSYKSAICRFVISVWIYAVKGNVFRVSIGESPISEMLKLVPWFTNSNATASVIMENIRCGIVATIAHRATSEVKFGFAHDM